VPIHALIDTALTAVIPSNADPATWSDARLQEVRRLQTMYRLATVLSERQATRVEAAARSDEPDQ
jgi:hypothetical protein